MVKEKIKNLVEETLIQKFPKLKEYFDGKTFASKIIIELPKHNLGDYAINLAFTSGFVTQLGSTSNQIAQILADELEQNKPSEISRIVATNSYVNFFLSESFLRKELEKIHDDRKTFGRSSIGKGRKIIVEYSQPNIAKQMHIGHLRTTILGEALANIFENLGHKVIRWNYLGDWGTQFGKLIAAFKLWGNKTELEISPMQILNDLYVKFHQELKEHPELEHRGQEEFAKLEGGDKENRKLWKLFRKLSLKEFQKIYKTLGIRFDSMMGESSFENELAPMVQKLRGQKIAEVGEEGAIIVKLERFNLPPALIQKADGASLYLTRDLALLEYRIKKFKPARILHVVGNEQALHFQQLSAIAKILDLQKPEHIKYGLVLGEDKKKMSTREGEAVPLEKVIQKAVNLAHEVVEKKNRDLSEKYKTQVASIVAIGALKYEMLKEHRNSDIVFSWNKMLDFTGNSAPYLQYTYARLQSILDKAGRIGSADFSKLVEESELSIIKHLLKFPDTIIDAGQTCLTNGLALYLYELSNLANRFYEMVPVLKDEETLRRHARLILIETVSAVLQKGLVILGIEVLPRI